MDRSYPSLDGTRRHLKAVRDFWYHLVVFLFVGGLLVIVDVRGGTGEGAILGLDWAYWVLLFWGIGVATHGIHAWLGDHRVESRHGGNREPVHH